MFTYRIFSVLGFRFLLFPSATISLTYYEATDGSTFYVQPDALLSDHRRPVGLVSDFGGKVGMDPDSTATRVYAGLRGDSKQSQAVKAQGLRQTLTVGSPHADGEVSPAVKAQ